VRAKISAKKSDQIMHICDSQQAFEKVKVNDMMDLFVI
jgi:hypothetical protein